MKQIKIFLFYWLPVLVWAGVIFYFSSIPDLQIEEFGVWDLILRKLAHALEFGVLAFLALRLGLRLEKRKTSTLIIVLIFCVLYAWSDEYHQTFVGGRIFSFRDILIDFLGASVFGWLFYKNKK